MGPRLPLHSLASSARQQGTGTSKEGQARCLSFPTSTPTQLPVQDPEVQSPLLHTLLSVAAESPRLAAALAATGLLERLLAEWERFQGSGPASQILPPGTEVRPAGCDGGRQQTRAAPPARL